MKTLLTLTAAAAAFLVSSCEVAKNTGLDQSGVIYTDRSISLVNLPGELAEFTYNFPKGAPKTAFIKYDDGKVEWLSNPVGGGYVNGQLVVVLASGTRVYVSQAGVKTERAPEAPAK